jgi:predicted lipoprotein with Yx(FWY)xxD motif
MRNSALCMTLASIAFAASSLTAHAYDRHVRIHNDTGLVLYKFQSTNSGASHWGHDVMGNSTLASGASMKLNFDNAQGYCEFDFRAVFEDGTVLEKANVNVCETGDYYYTE